MDHRFKGDNAVGGRESVHYFEFDSVHGRAYNESIANADRAVGLCEVRFEEGCEQITVEAFNGVFKWEDLNAFTILTVDSVDRDDVAQTDAQVFADHAIDANTTNR